MSHIMPMEQRLGRVRLPSFEKQEKIISDKIMLRLAHIVIALLLAVIGFVMTNYVEHLDKAIEKITESQEKLTVIVTRLDESVQNINHRIERIENKQP